MQLGIVVLAHRRNPQSITDHQPSLAAPGLEFGQGHQCLESLGVEADRPGELADITLKASIADVGGHQGIGHGLGIILFQLGDGEEGRQLDLAQLLKRLLDGSHFLIGAAITAPEAREVLGHHGHFALAPLVHPTDVGLAEFAHPIGIATEDTGAKIPLEARPRIVQHVQRRAQEHVETHRPQFPSHDLADFLGVIHVPGGAEGHVVRHLCYTGGDLGIGKAIPILSDSDEQGNEGYGTGQRLTGSEGLEAIGQIGYLEWCILSVGEVTVVSQEHHSAHSVVPDELGDIRPQAGIAASKGDQEQLAHLLLHRHTIHEPLDEIALILRFQRDRQEQGKQNSSQYH